MGVSASAPPAPAEEPLLRFCLACRGYSCPECWNDDAGFCQTCVPVEVPVVEMPVVVIPAPQMAFAEESELAPAVAAEPASDDDNWLDARLLSVAAMSAMPEAKPVAEVEAELLFEAEPVVEARAEMEVEAEVEAELVVEAEVVAEAVSEGEAEVEAEALVEAEQVMVMAAMADEAEAEAESEMVASEATVEPEPVPAEAAETFAMDERPIELVLADEEPIAEPEPDMTWDWDFVAETEAAPIEMPEPFAEPIAAATEAADVAQPNEPDGLVEAPVIPARPEALPPPVYRPLPPLGPILPPPPAAASMSPRIEFDLLQPPPAFVIAPSQAQALMRPTLPVGLFDGPAPQIRPCHQCELPVSAKARFCRRCGSAQN